MNKLKSLVHRDKNGEASTADSAASSTGKMTGQGSHFGDGASHTTPTKPSDYEQVSSYVPGTDATTHSSAPKPTTTSAVPDSYPVTKSATTAAMTETTGPSRDVATDPTTSVKSETPAPTGASGVPQGAALAAASTAFQKAETGGMPGGFPTDEYVNPYKAEHIDPRVDGKEVDRTSAVPSTTASHQTGSSYNREAALGTGLGVGGAAATIAGATATSKAHEPAGASGANISTTTDPATRSEEYSKAANTKVPDSNAPVQTTTRNAAAENISTTTDPLTRSADYSKAADTKIPDSREQQSGTSTLGKVLGAVGLGTAGTAAAKAISDKDNSAVATDTTPQSAPPSHYRKESIPTTAYPAGADSPAAIHPPVGGSSTSTSHPEQERQSHVGRDVAIGAAGVGATALGVGEYEKHRSAKDTQPIGTGPVAVQPPQPATSIPAQTGGQADAQPIIDRPHPLAGQHEHQPSTRDAVIGTAGVGAGVAGLHEYDKNKDLRQTMPGAATAAEAPAGTSMTDPKSQPFISSSQTQSGPSATQTQPLTSSTYAQPIPTSTQAQPLTSSSYDQPETISNQPQEDHTARNAALGAAGAGAAGLGVYEYEKNKGSKMAEPSPAAPFAANSADSQSKGFAPSQASTYGAAPQQTPAPRNTAPAVENAKPYEDPAVRRTDVIAVPMVATATTANEPTSKAKDLPVEKQKASEGVAASDKDDSHKGRDAALIGAAGAGAGAYAVHEHEKDQAEKRAAEQAQHHKLEKSQEQQREALEKQRKEQEKAAAKEEKQHQKEEKEHQKEMAKREKEEKKHQKELEKEEHKHQKELERQEKEERKHEKEVAAAAAAEKKHQHELEKEEKKRQHEREEEEKKHRKEAVLAEQEEKKHQQQTEHDKQAGDEQDLIERRKREYEEKRKYFAEDMEHRLEAAEHEKHAHHEKEGAVAAAVGVGAGAAAYEHNKHDNEARKSPEDSAIRDTQSSPISSPSSKHHKEEKEKKPGFFKRIFKRRKNKDTGLEEEYSTDESEGERGHEVLGAGSMTTHKAAAPVVRDSHSTEQSTIPTSTAEKDHATTRDTATATAGTAGIASTAATAGKHEESGAGSQEEHHGRRSYEELSGGMQKPSYNPFSKDKPHTTTV